MGPSEEDITTDARRQTRIQLLKCEQRSLIRDVRSRHETRIETVRHQRFGTFFGLVAHFVVRVIAMRPIAGE